MSAVDPPRPIDVLVDDVWVSGWLVGWDAGRQVGTVRYTRYVQLASLTGPVSYSEAAGSSWFHLGARPVCGANSRPPGHAGVSRH